MGVITISRQYGSEGRKIGRAVAEALGYLYIDKDLMVEVAHEAQVPVSEVARYDECPEHPALRVLRKLLISPYPEDLVGPWEGEWASGFWVHRQIDPGDIVFLDEDTCVRLTGEAMLRLTDRGNVVLMGRGGQALLAHPFDVLHVRIVAPETFRVKTIVEREGLSRAEAIGQIQKVDEQRKRYIKRHYTVNWDDPLHYHLIINTGWTGVEVAACLLVEAVRHLPFKRKWMG